MKYLSLAPREFTQKVNDARIDVQLVAQLRELSRQEDGTSFMVEKNLYIWVETDKTPHDGRSSISPIQSSGAPGRYRLATIGMPLAR